MIAEWQKDHGWGKSVVESLARDLRLEFPGMGGFSVQNLWYMRQFYLSYSGSSKLQPLVKEISWSKHLLIMGRCKNDLKRGSYVSMTSQFHWPSGSDQAKRPQSQF
jgi:predicted nuclease of restriction endonuclease-like (RecB) superfamily